MSASYGNVEGKVPRVKRKMQTGKSPSIGPVRPAKPLKSIGRRAHLHYDPKTGRKL